MRIANRRIADQFRARRKNIDALAITLSSDACLTEIAAEAEAHGGWEEGWNWETRRALVYQAMLRVRTRVKPKPFEAYRLGLWEELRVSEIARRLDWKSAQVSLAKHRVGGLVRKEIHRMERETLREGAAITSMRPSEITRPSI